MNKPASHTPMEILRNIYEEKMPFNRLLGIEVVTLERENVRVKVSMKTELVGNFMRDILHGGVISSVLDLTGGLVVSVELLHRLEDQPPEKIIRCMSRLSTIDLRVDYLRAGQGEFFFATGTIMRLGNRVAVTRTELINNRDILIAVGTASYQIS